MGRDMKLTPSMRCNLLLAGMILVILFGMVHAGQAEETPAPEPVVKTAPPAYQPAAREYKLWRSVLALVLVVGAFGALNWYLKTRSIGPLKARNARRLRVVEKLSLDQKRSILLLALDGQELLVGVGADQISLLNVEGGALADFPEISAASQPEGRPA